VHKTIPIIIISLKDKLARDLSTVTNERQDNRFY